VRRFSANKSKARQATSRAKMIDKIKIEDFKPSSRAYPFVRFEGEKKLHRLAVETEGLTKAYDRPLFKNFSIMVEAGERVAIIGANGAGKTTLLRCIGGKDITGLDADHGRTKWAENASVGYMPQDPTEEFPTDAVLTDWMGRWTKEGDDDLAVRSILGRLLFSGDEVKKSVKVLSGGEKGRMMYGKLMLGRHNVMLLDEPTNHMDMESIESLNIALDKYEGTLIFVSHDREFVSSLATRVLEVKENEVIDFRGTYEEYLTSQGID
jgi:ATPase subunit of ABC transporter with duplicated ATPase domains